MVNKTSSRKRPCRICRRWFVPNPRLKERQKTCGQPECKKEWHRKKCVQWNKSNVDYFKAIYLQRKLHALSHSQGVSGSQQRKSHASVKPAKRASYLPCEIFADEIGLEQHIILEYVIHSLIRRFHMEIKSCHKKQLPKMRGHPSSLL